MGDQVGEEREENQESIIPQKRGEDRISSTQMRSIMPNIPEMSKNKTKYVHRIYSKKVGEIVMIW